MNGPSGQRSSLGFGPEKRLRAPGQFKTVFRRNVRSHDRSFTVLAHRTDDGRARLGMAVSRKACGNAVVRNRMKRVIRESFRAHADALPSVDLVVIVKPGAGTMANPALFASLAHHWQVIRQKCVR
ncbi:MAG: ribonuclease P protein component [Pseudomonadota bacterium]